MFDVVYQGGPTAYTLGSYRITNSFETGLQIYDDLEEFVEAAQALLDDDSI